MAGNGTLEELLEQVESMQRLLSANLSDSDDVAELKTKMKYLWGNGKPGKIDELESASTRLTQSYWYMKGALWVLIALVTMVITPLAIFLMEQWLMAHK